MPAAGRRAGATRVPDVSDAARPGRPASVDRRKLLAGLGFGAVNYALLRHLPDAGRRAVLAAAPPAGAPTPVLAAGVEPLPPGHRFELVIRDGRVMDPDTGFDGRADVGVDGGHIAAISTEPLDGVATVDAAGLVVAPGFIDVLSYDPNPFGIWFKVADGVTTNLGMHGINAESGSFMAHWTAAGSPCHFGGAFDDAWARERLGIRSDQPATPAQIAELEKMARSGLEQGWIGINVEPEYTPGVDTAEITALGRLAAEYGVPVCFHGRYSDVEPPGTNADTLAEIVETARTTGAAVHVEHIVSTGGTFSMGESLDTLRKARREGLAVTACTYPYDFWATYLGSARFAPGWQERFRIGYDDLALPATGERLTASTFERYRKENRLAVAYAIPEADVRLALQGEFVMIGSDSILEPGAQNHPRGAGAFARTLGRYVREENVLELMDAIGKMTILPARWLEGRAPALRRKGRMQVGADADITVFDPRRIEDRATVKDPAQESVGVEWVIVEGQVVKDPDGMHKDVQPGRPVAYGT